MPTANTDWLHELFGDSFTQEHSISVNGGTDVMQYYMSANYLDEGGLLKYGMMADNAIHLLVKSMRIWQNG